MTVAGCTPPPGSRQDPRLRTRKPTLRLGVRPADGAPGLREVRLLLPDALRGEAEASPRAARAPAPARAARAQRVRLTRDGELRVTLPGGRARYGEARQGRGPVQPQLARERKPKRRRWRARRATPTARGRR